MILAGFLLDTAVIPAVYRGVYAVPLTLIAVFLIGMLMGRMTGLLYGTVGGLLIDITTGTLGIMTFYFMAVGFLIGLILYNPSERARGSRRLMRRRQFARGAWVFVLYALGEAVLFVIQYFHTTRILPVYFVNIAVRGLICVALTLLALPLARRWLRGDQNRVPNRSREVKSF